MRLVDMGNTIVVIEHNLDVIKSRRLDHRPRPGGGARRRPDRRPGTPEDVVRTEESLTGKFLKKVLP